MKVRKLGITGSRPPKDGGDIALARFQRLVEYGYAWVESLPRDGTVALFHGDAEGLDRILGKHAFWWGLWVIPIQAPWHVFLRLDLNLRAAGPVRNEVLVGIVDELYGFWDGSSKGTKGCMDLGRAAGKLRGIWTPDGPQEV